MFKSPMVKMLIGLAILFGVVFGFKAFKNYKLAAFMKSKSNPIITVTATELKYAEWQPRIKSSGSTRSILGVDITTELSGMVKEVYFKPGDEVEKGALLARLNIAPDVAQLNVLKANATLAKINYNRDKAQYKIKAVSRATLDTDEANLKSALAQVAEQKAIIEQKTIRAPFKGRLGISYIYPGQYLSPGDKVTMIQNLDPIYVDFFVPQQNLHKLKLGQKTTVILESLPNRSFIGKITTINPGVDPSVRNVEVEATIPNADKLIAPGIFTTVYVNTGKPNKYLTLPQTAITFDPYGNSVFLITHNTNGDLVANQKFVITGETRGDQITILKGLKEGDQVVTSGQLKLKNGIRVKINNSIKPKNNPHPNPSEEKL